MSELYLAGIINLAFSVSLCLIAFLLIAKSKFNGAKVFAGAGAVVMVLAIIFSVVGRT